jgi:hypothetical protein
LAYGEGSKPRAGAAHAEAAMPGHGDYAGLVLGIVFLVASAEVFVILSE